jgi:hypothetical protein
VISARRRTCSSPRPRIGTFFAGSTSRKGATPARRSSPATQYLGRLKERAFVFHAESDARPGERLFSAAFGDQACGTVVDAAAAPDGGCDLIAVVQLAAAERDDVRLGSTDGPALARLPLPYAIPAPTAPRGRQR